MCWLQVLPKGPVMRSFCLCFRCCQPEQVVDQTVELSVIWETMPLMPLQHVMIPTTTLYDDVIKWKHFPCYWPSVPGIHRWPVNSPHKGQWRRALMIHGWVNNRESGDLRRHRAHYDVIAMYFLAGEDHILLPKPVIMNVDPNIYSLSVRQCFTGQCCWTNCGAMSILLSRHYYMSVFFHALVQILSSVPSMSTDDPALKATSSVLGCGWGSSGQLTSAPAP